MLILSDILASAFLAAHELYRIIRRHEDWKRLVLYMAVWVSAVLLFIKAPFIRYGLAFLLMLPLLAAVTCIDLHQKGVVRISLGVPALMILLLFTPYIDNYFQDFGVFVRHNVMA